MARRSTTTPSPHPDVTTRDQWRAWLEQNHLTTFDVWIVTGTAAPDETVLGYEDAFEEALYFGWVEVATRRGPLGHTARQFRRSPGYWPEDYRRPVTEMLAQLKADSNAWLGFRRMSPVRRRAELRWILQARSGEGRKHRYSQVVARLLQDARGD